MTHWPRAAGSNRPCRPVCPYPFFISRILPGFQINLFSFLRLRPASPSDASFNRHVFRGFRNPPPEPLRRGMHGLRFVRFPLGAWAGEWPAFRDISRLRLFFVESSTALGPRISFPVGWIDFWRKFIYFPKNLFGIPNNRRFFSWGGIGFARRSCMKGCKSPLYLGRIPSLLKKRGRQWLYPYRPQAIRSGAISSPASGRFSLISSPPRF